MASSTREVLITIRLEEGGSNTPNPNPQPIPDELKDDKKKTLKSVLVHQGLNTGLELITQGANATMDRYASMKENYLVEQFYKNTSTFIGKAAKLGSVVAGGLALGGSYGAIVGVMGFGISEALSFQGRYSSYFRDLNASNMGVDFARTRAGLIDNGRGTEN